MTTRRSFFAKLVAVVMAGPLAFRAAMKPKLDLMALLHQMFKIKQQRDVESLAEINGQYFACGSCSGPVEIDHREGVSSGAGFGLVAGFCPHCRRRTSRSRYLSEEYIAEMERLVNERKFTDCFFFGDRLSNG